ncbi:hypothetical protein [Nostoc sp. KVJ20]|uniref:hypothetical protein n=1 Tax=Nostoc sp. KVJ20 TaxID=457944 RepID=UPI00114CCB08|nr:hypothetical protein [Nostoc sp. KVJ20]
MKLKEVFIMPQGLPPLERLLIDASNDPYSRSKLQEAFKNEDYTTAYLVLAPHFAYAYGLQWIYKARWNSNYKIPLWRSFTNPGRQCVKAFGDFLNALLEVCREIYIYENAGEMFKYIVWELKKEEIDWQVSKKSEVIKTHQNRIGKLKKRENPYNSEDFPHLHRLIGECFDAGDGNNLFRINYFLVITRAYSAWVADMQSNPSWVTIFQENGKILHHASQGKGKKCLFQ